MSAGTRFAFTMAWRESRAALGRLWLLTASVSLGVAALVAINSFTDDLRLTVRDQARTLLGADLSLGGSARFSERAEAELGRLASAAEIARVVRFAAMAYVPSGTGARLVQVTAIDGAYPFYGRVEIAPPEAWARLAQDRTVLQERLALRRQRVDTSGDQRLHVLGNWDVSAGGQLPAGAATD